MFVRMGLQVVLLFGSAFFSGSETALFSRSEIALVGADRIKLAHAARLGRRGSQTVLELFRRPERVLTTTLVGTNIATVTLTPWDLLERAQVDRYPT